MLIHQRHDLLHDEQDEEKAAAGEERIVQAEEELELVWWLVLHPRLDAEDGDEVGGEGREDLLGRREGRLPGHIVCELVRYTERRERETGQEEIREGSHGRRGRRRCVGGRSRATFSKFGSACF